MSRLPARASPCFAPRTFAAAAVLVATLVSPVFADASASRVATRPRSNDGEASVSRRPVASATRVLPPDAPDARVRARAADELGLAVCGDSCVSLRTPFPPETSSPSRLLPCELRAPPSATLDGVPVSLLSHAFDGADVRVEMDLREALRRAGASAGDTFSLDVRASLACPKRTYDASVVDAEALGAELRRDASAPGRVAWIFPFNFFLVEEFALLADSIESLVEAGDNLQITVTDDDGGDAFLFGGFSFPLREDPRNEAEPPEAAADPIDPIEESIGQAMTFLESVAAAFDDAVDDAANPPPFAFEFPALEGITA